MPKDLERTLLLFPCCAKKQQLAVPSKAKALQDRIGSFLSKSSKATLKTTRKQTKKAFPDDFSAGEKWEALYLYDGHQYNVPSFRKKVVRAVRKRGLSCCILSGGFGLVWALEPIRNYNVSMQKSAKFWRRVLPVLLQDFIRRNKIKKVFVAGSASYLGVLKDPRWRTCGAKVYSYIPQLAKGEGGALTKVPKMVGKAVTTFLDGDTSSWKVWR